MFGLLLAGLSAAFGELSDSIGKYEVRKKVVSFYTFGFLNMLFSTLFIVAAGIIRHDFVFSFASLPTFIPRLALEILQAQISILAIVRADRGDFGLIRVLTVPLLLIVDILLGYSLAFLQVIGIFLIVGAVMFLFFSERLRAKGSWLVLASAINAVVTISLYKYDISHFNSFEFEQSIVCLTLMLYFYLLAAFVYREDPLKFLAKPLFFGQAVSSGLSTMAGSFAIVFAPASVITAALRAYSVLFSILSGRFYFKEKRFGLKLGLFCMIALGLFCLAQIQTAMIR